MNDHDVIDRLVKSGTNRLVIGSDRTESSDGTVIEVLDPSTGEPVATVPSGSSVDASAAVEAASGALADFAASSPIDRSEILRRAYELMTERIESLATLVVFEMGKTYAEAEAASDVCESGSLRARVSDRC